MGSSKKTKAQLEAEVQRLRSGSRSNAVVQVISQTIKWGGLCFLAWCFKESIEALAGKDTLSDIKIALLSDLNINQWLAYAVGGGGIVYGLSQRHLRKSTVETIQSRNQKLEKMVDPKRSSSNLTPRGNTRPEDK